jgi:hypothetical protein
MERRKKEGGFATVGKEYIGGPDKVSASSYREAKVLAYKYWKRTGIGLMLFDVESGKYLGYFKGLA